MRRGAGEGVTAYLIRRLLLVIRNKHAHLRATRVARSLPIVDEIHASDAYMAKVTVEAVRRGVGALR
jgi:hypothetical protein